MQISALFIAVSCLASFVFSLPIPSAENVLASSFSKRNFSNEVLLRGDVAYLNLGDIITRDLGKFKSSILESRARPAPTAKQIAAGQAKAAANPGQRKERKIKKKEAKTQRVEAAKAKPGNEHQRPGTKVSFWDAAKDKLDELDLHGKHRKHAKAYHKNIVKQEMKKIPEAQTAKIIHLAHTGGSDPNEKNHITVAMYGANEKQIKSPWTINKEVESGKPARLHGLFHVYPEDHKDTQHTEPPSFQKARAKSAAKQAAAAEKAKADKAKDRAQRAALKKTAGKLISEALRDDPAVKKAHREERKNLKKNLKNPE